MRYNISQTGPRDCHKTAFRGPDLHLAAHWEHQLVMCGANESMIQHMENCRVLGILGTHKEEVTAGCLLVFFGFYVLLPGYFQLIFQSPAGSC